MTVLEGVSLKTIFGPGGLLAARLEDFEYRPSQLRMAEEVLQAIEEGGQLCVEAGTGTGKTLAYLIPALYSRKRVIVSTATKNLQDQLFSKDLPFIREYLFPDLSVTYMKGRQNYACLKRLEERRPTLLPEQNEELERIAQWARESPSGDRAELDWLSDQDPLWNSIDARSDTCVGQQCTAFDRCFITRMRRKAFESDLIVVNHALFFANLALESDEIGKVLPDFGVLILDEAHEVEDIAASHFGLQLSNYQFEELIRDLSRELTSLRLPLGQVAKRVETLFRQFPSEQGSFSLSFSQPSHLGGVDLREKLAAPYRELKLALSQLHSELHLIQERSPDWEPLVRRLNNLGSSLDQILGGDDPSFVYWYERRRQGVFLRVTPIDVAVLLRERLFARTPTTVLTSATLTTGGSFDYLRDRLGLEEPVELVVEGEFNYEQQAILYVPRHFPDPRSEAYLSHALETISRILEISGGGAFLLFTSFRNLEQIYRRLMEESRYPLLRQGEMPKNRLLERFRKAPGSVLCATASFWQGVDVKGQALRAVVIDKLPFRVPSDPVVAARLRRLREEGENAFLGYTVPDAVITLKQGLGRLIRSRRDRGILAILDSRLRTKTYGEIFLQSLPSCPITDNIGSLRNFFSMAASRPTGGKK